MRGGKSRSCGDPIRAYARQAISGNPAQNDTLPVATTHTTHASRGTTDVRTHLRICHQTWHRLSSALFGAGLALIAITTVEVDAWAMYRLGLLLALFGGVRLIIDKVSADDDDMEAGRQSGYDDGYEDGCEDGREIRPTSKFSAASPAVARLPRSGPTEQLGEQGDVGEGQQRIV